MNRSDTGDLVENEHGLKRYALTEEGLQKWVVSGVSRRSGKRWRRRFETREAADEFFERMTRRAVGAGAATDGTDDLGRGDRKQVAPKSPQALKSGSRWREVAYKAVIVVLVVGVSFFLDAKFSGLRRLSAPEQRLANDFQSNPSLQGWEPSEKGAVWRLVEEGSAERALAMGEGTWASPPESVRAYSWYRVSFRARRAEASSDPVAAAEVEFAVPGSHHLRSIVKLPLRVDTGWLANDFRVRVPGLGSDGGREGALQMRCRFIGKTDAQWLVDDFLLEPLSDIEVGHWADIMYARIGVRLQYRPKPDRWARLPETLRRLKDHQKLRIAFAGGPAIESLCSTPIDVFLHRMYPGAIVELVGPVGSAGNSAAAREWLDMTKPDLVVFGGGSDEASRNFFLTLHEALKARNEKTASSAEILVLTDGWTEREGGTEELMIHSGMRELDQDPAANAGAPDDYRSRWMTLAAERCVEFLDAMGILSEFVFGPAVVAKVGPATASDGVPYHFRLRDWLNSAETGRQVMARIFESYFRPPDAAALMAAAKRKGAAVRLFDPDNNPKDRAVLESVRAVYQPASLERAVFAATYSDTSAFLSRSGSAGGTGRFRVQDQHVREVGFTFDEPVDVRNGDVAIYWSFRADRSKGEEAGKVTMHLAYAGEGKASREERAQVSFTVRPGASAFLRVSGELAGVEEIEHEVEVPVENFTDPNRAARFRMIVRWGGADRVVAEVASWNPRSKRWEGYVPFDRPGAPPLVMDMSITDHLLASSFFRAIYFEAQSEVPFLESVLVTARPSLIK